MAVVERNVPIAGENMDPDGHPATDMYENWSSEIEEKSEIPGGGKNQEPSCTPEEKEKRIKELDEVIKEDLDS